MSGQKTNVSDLGARKAAQQYASDEEFARAFDDELALLYKRQLEALERLATRLGRKPVEGKTASKSTSHGGDFTPDDVLHLLHSRRKEWLTRGEIALQLGCDNREPRLTRVLRMLKDQGTIKQKGVRRAARYSSAG